VKGEPCQEKKGRRSQNRLSPFFLFYCFYKLSAWARDTWSFSADYPLGPSQGPVERVPSAGPRHSKLSAMPKPSFS